MAGEQAVSLGVGKCREVRIWPLNITEIIGQQPAGFVGEVSRIHKEVVLLSALNAQKPELIGCLMLSVLIVKVAAWWHRINTVFFV